MFLNIFYVHLSLGNADRQAAPSRGLISPAMPLLVGVPRRAVAEMATLAPSRGADQSSLESRTARTSATAIAARRGGGFVVRDNVQNKTAWKRGFILGTVAYRAPNPKPPQRKMEISGE
jgi:hypothetical protein